MKLLLRTTVLGIGLIAAAGGTLAFTAHRLSDDDEVVHLTQLPAAVQRTIREYAKGGKIERIERSTEDGRVAYEVEVEGAGGDFEFLVGPDGAYVGEDQEEADDDDEQRGSHEGDDEEHVEVIKFGDAPQAVQNAFSRLAGGAAASKVERITDEEVTRFEIEFAADGGTASLTLAEAGDLLERESPMEVGKLPEAVLREVQKDFPGATIEAAEAVELHYFEIEVVVDGKTFEVAAFATGDIEDHAGPGGDDDENGADADDDDDIEHGNRGEQDGDEEDDD